MQPVDIHRQVGLQLHSTGMEFHYYARGAGMQGSPEGCAAVGRAASRLNWAAINPAPVRITKGAPRGPAIPALYFWGKTGQHLWCESQEEKTELMWMDHSGEVAQVWSQPFSIIFSTARGDWHVPDFLCHLTDGTFCVVDVRPVNRLNAADKEKFDRTAIACDKTGWGFRLLTGHNRDASQVLKWMSASRHARCAPPADVAERIVHAAKSGAPWGHLCKVGSPECPPLAASWVDHLIWTRQLLIDFAQRFDSDTVCTAAEDAPR